MHLSPLTLADRPLVNDYLKRFPPTVSELTFTNLFAWRHGRPVWFIEFKNSLLFFAQTRMGLTILGNPIGQATLSEALERFGARINGVERFPRALLAGEQLPIHARTEDDRDNADYVYRVRELADLTGRGFAGKRNHVTRCQTEHHCCYEEISPNNLDDCLAMQERWCAARDCGATPGLCGEYRAIVEALSHFREFDLFGGAIRIGGQIEAFTVGEPLNPDTAVCHFEKAMPQFHGLGQLINHWFAKFRLTDFAYVNREQDLGIPGLRRAKESYAPDHLVEKVRIVLSPPKATTMAPPPSPEAERRCPE